MRPTPKNHHRTLRLLAVCVFCLTGLFSASTLFAQNTPATSPATLSSNRFLFIEDTSATMRRHASQTVDVTTKILRSSGNGQLHDGDGIGIWTFNEDVYSGRLPLQTWAAADKEEITLRVMEFLRRQPYEKRANLGLVMSAVDKIVKASDIITIVIVSDGHLPIQGTPFDREINRAYLQCLQDMKKDPMPVFTVLQGKHGKLFRFTVNALPWPVVIPEVPIPLKMSDIASVPDTTAAAAPMAATPKPAPAPIVTQLPPVAPPAPAPLPTPISSLQPPVAPQMATPPSPGPPQGFVPPPRHSDEFAARPPSPAPPMSPPSEPAPAPVVAQEIPEASAMPVSTPASQPDAPSSPRVSPPAPVARSPVKSSATAEPPNKSLIAQATGLIKSFSGNHPTLLLAIGSLLLLTAVGIVFLMARRSRGPERVSLITQTMNQRHK